MSNVTMVKVRTFGEALALLREERGLSHRELAARVGVAKGDIKAWERNEGAPNAFQFKKLLGSIQRLWGFASMLPREQREEVRAERLNETKEPGTAASFVEPEPEPPTIEPPPPPKTFGEALRAARLREGLDQHEIAEMLSVEQASVSRWELETCAPIADHYRKLVDLMPALKDAPKPIVRDIEKPTGNTLGAYRAPTDPPVERALSAPAVPPVPVVVTPVPQPRTALEEAGVAYAKALARSGESIARYERAEAELEKAGRERDAAIIAANEAADKLFSLTIGNRPVDPEYDRKMQAAKKRLRESFLSEVMSAAKGA